MSTITRAEQTNSFFNDSTARNRIVKEATSRGFVQMSLFCNDFVRFNHKFCNDVKVMINWRYGALYPGVETSWSASDIEDLTVKQVELYGKAVLSAAKLMKSIESIIHTIKLTKKVK